MRNISKLFNALRERELHGRIFAVLLGVTAATSTAEALAQGGAWETKAPMFTARATPAIAELDGTLYAMGGFTGFTTCSVVATVEAYNTATNTWTQEIAPMPTARGQHAAVAIDGIIYVVGGLTSCGAQALATLEAYDPATNTWTTKASMPTARGQLAVGVVNGILYAVGGVYYVGVNGFTSNAVEAYDPVTNTWTTKAPLPTARYGLGAGVLNDVLYTLGGSLISGVLLATVEAYHPASNSWTTEAPMPTPRAFGWAVGTIDETLYVAGGTKTGVPDATVVAYYTLTNSWGMETPMITPRVNLGGGVVGGVLYAVGGQVSGGFAQSIVEAFTPGKSPWANLGNSLAGQGGVPTLVGVGSLLPGSLVSLALDGAAAFSPSTLVIGISQLNAPFKGGTLVPSPLILFPLTTDFFGQSTFAGLWPAGIPSGFSIYFQWWVADSAGPVGFAASNAVSGTTP